MRRRIAVALALTAACGSTPPADQEASAPPYRDLPDVPRRTIADELPSQYELPAQPSRRLVRVRSSRASTSPRRADPVPSAGGEASSDVWHALAVCESGMRQDAVSPDGLYLSYFQWALSTWRSVGGAGDPRTVGYETQVELAKRLQARSGWGQWPRCSRRLGLR